jgi:hypothetical protein
VPGSGAEKRRGALYHLALFLTQLLPWLAANGSEQKILPAWDQEDKGGRFYRRSHTEVRERGLLDIGVRRHLAQEMAMIG